jgi:hypothetical protein
VQNTTPRLLLIPIAALAPALFGQAGCGSDSPSTTDAAQLFDGAPASPDGAPPSPTWDGSACNVLVESQPNGGHLHTPDCTPVTYASNPPSSGTHYPDWAMYKTYSAPVPWGFLVHDLEHGAVVVSYNCPEGCPDEVAQAQAMLDALPLDRACGNARMRTVLVPEPDLTVRWAASAWTWPLRADCFDNAAFAAFIAAHYQGPDTEAACGGGVDLSATGWCQ